ncbi:hypothetical protein [Desulfurispira natronophila]|uniref:Uncharacterized protein n=1 Tax=Desulfurispira natronophila TaxID=682562 RepID=A0A7W7Y3X9_9BACT|nr:hypothetical protein [Desulfurispira natronophila]MBB5021625.1 hypothetical protein [Desulfurispira natronophila]
MRKINFLAILLLLTPALSHALVLDSTNPDTIFHYTGSQIAINRVGLELADLTVEAGEPEQVGNTWQRTVELHYELAADNYLIYNYTEELPVNINQQTGAVTLVEPVAEPNPAAQLDFPLWQNQDGERFHIMVRRQVDSLNLEVIKIALEPYASPHDPEPERPPVAEPYWYDEQTGFNQVRDINSPNLFHYRDDAGNHIVVRFSRYRIDRSNPIVGGNFASVREVASKRYQRLDEGFFEPDEFTREVSANCVNRRNDTEIFSYFAQKDDNHNIRTDLIWIPYEIKYGTGFYLEVTAEGPGITPYNVGSPADTFLRSITPRCRYYGFNQ